MFDLFGKKRRQKLFDTAYAEFVSGNYGLALKNLSQLILEGDQSFNSYNLRSQTYLALNQMDLAFKDALNSTKVEPNFDKNKLGYDIRNFITLQLKNGQIKVDLFELLTFFDPSNVLQLFIESVLIGIEEVEKESRIKFPGNRENLLKRATYIALKYLKWTTNHFIKYPKESNYNLNEINQLNKHVISYLNQILGTIGNNSNDTMALINLETNLNIDEHHLWVSFFNHGKVSQIRDYLIDQYYPLNQELEPMVIKFLWYLENNIIKDPFNLIDYRTGY